MGGYIRQIEVIEEDTGEVVHTSASKGSRLGKGWVIMYTEKITDFVISCPSASTVKVFLILAAGQKFENHGMITTKKAVQEKLGITKQTCLEAFKYLKERMIINECKIDGVTEFMVNPELVMVGNDKKARVAEWQRRWNSLGKVVNLAPPKKSKRGIS